MSLARFPGLLAAALLALSCHDVTGPDPAVSSLPVFSHTGTGPGFYGTGSIGTGAATPGGSRQDFQFDIAPDLRTGTLSYRDWSIVRPDGSTTVTLTVSVSDPYTAIATFRDRSAACADPTRGAEFDGYARLDDGGLVAFAVVACDNGAGGSGADMFRISVPGAGYQREGLLSSGDVVKGSALPPPANPQVTGLGWIPPGRPTPDSYGKNFDFQATAGSGGRMAYIDYQVRQDGSRGTFTVNSQTDPATGVTSYHQLSSTCVRFGGTGRMDTGQLASFWVDACDEASPGTGFDTFGIRVPDVFAQSGTLTDGDIVLSAPAPTTGDLSVAAATTGESLDPDGYTVTVDGADARSLPINGGSVTYTGVSAGSHSLALSGVASNCTVNGGNSQDVSVPAGGTASTTFSVGCTALSGNLNVTVSTSGVNLDPDGYTVNLDGANPRAIPINNGSVSYTNLSAGTHSVTLTGMAANCKASGGNPREVSVPSGGTASTAFAVTCEPGPATRVVFTVQPSNTKVNSTIQPPVQVTALDAQGNRATSFNGLVTIAIGHNGGGILTPGTLSGTRTVSAVNGVATFSDLRIDRAGDYTLRITSSGLTGAESQTFRIENLVCVLGICL
jgi:hypothetical protein